MLNHLARHHGVEFVLLCGRELLHTGAEVRQGGETIGIGLLVSLGGLNVVLARVNGSDLGPQPCQRLGDDTSSTANIQDPEVMSLCYKDKVF